jgi:ATP-dependent DNA helicase PIF1
VNRLRLVSDPSLGLRVTPAPVVSEAPAAPPVVMPKRRPAEYEPELPFSDAPVAADVFVPVVRKRTGGSAPAHTGSSPAAVLDPPPERIAPVLDPVSIWPSPVPTFTALLGAAGSGKTFETKAWAEREKGILLAATTGIAAINLGGETINSVLGYFDTASLQESFLNGFLTARLGKLWRAGVRRLVLDEVSMLPADQLTFLVKAIEEVNGRGYVLGKWAQDPDEDRTPPQMGLSLVGDFAQLSPVRAGYAFESPEWGRFAEHTITLTEIRRQSDPQFIEMLRAARIGRGDIVADYFQSHNAIHQETDDHYDGATVLAKNESVDRYNALRMAQLTGEELTFPSTRWGKQRSEWGNPEKPPATWGIPEVLRLKKGALVMVLSNQRDELRRLVVVNGDLGRIEDADNGIAWVALQRTGEIVPVLPVTRQVKVPIDSARRTELRKEGKSERIEGKWEITGEISYTPLRVAYASTCHKSQGLSLDRVQINLRDAFWKSPGMVYVGLSRARTMEGLRLVGSPKAIIERCSCDPRLREWL